MIRATLILSLVAMASVARAAAPPYVPPEETAALAAGPGVEVAQANCAACHSAEYISTQPRGLPNPTAFWTAEVTKMQKFYAAPIADADVATIVGYLVATYGKPAT